MSCNSTYIARFLNKHIANNVTQCEGQKMERKVKADSNILNLGLLKMIYKETHILNQIILYIKINMIRFFNALSV